VLIWFAVLVVNFKGEDKKRFGHDQFESAQGLLSGSQAYEFQHSGEEAFYYTAGCHGPGEAL